MVIKKLTQTKSMATDTHRFNLHLHYEKRKLPTLISQYTQGLKKNIRVYLLLFQPEVTNLANCLTFQSCWTTNTINLSNNTLAMYAQTLTLTLTL